MGVFYNKCSMHTQRRASAVVSDQCMHPHDIAHDGINCRALQHIGCHELRAEHRDGICITSQRQGAQSVESQCEKYRAMVRTFELTQVLDIHQRAYCDQAAR